MAKNKNFSLLRASVQSASERLRPILMTTFTTTTALIPTMLDFGEGSQLWRPLAITVFWGLSISTFLTLLIVPVMFFHFQGRTINRGGGFSFFSFLRRKKQFRTIPIH
ncbi:efflux RND transporter permease subunit [Leptospira licerasiae]|uniref:efflux RND transporter permease subunit n=1 Tax=Leptospira licerasiae TaxID=447106 RepID=UPI0020C7C019|nr:efflux RND transporter permease subunit [Leptospira licerasiae]